MHRGASSRYDARCIAQEVNRMRRHGLLWGLLLVGGMAQASVSWSPMGPESVVAGGGNLDAPGGAALTLSAEATGPSGFAGAITALEADAYRGRDVELSGVLEVLSGPGVATLWLRADGPDGRLAFTSTGAHPVALGEGARSQVLRLYVPPATTRLKLGVTLQPTGAMTARAVRLKALSARTLLEAAIHAVREQALHADRIDWAAVTGRLPALDEAPASAAHAPIRQLLQALGDRHSMLQSAEASAQYRADAVATEPIASDVRDGVGYLRVPGLRGTDREAGRRFGETLCAAIADQRTAASSGWIVDLRGNMGGNMWPMLAGLRPLLGDGDIGAIKDRAGRSTAWRPDRLDACASDLAGVPVAVLIGPETASSGEAVAVAFRGRARTRFFGQPTAGLATSNQDFPLPDGSRLWLTTAAFVDRKGHAYPEGVSPDVALDDAQNAVEIAAAWVRSQNRGQRAISRENAL
ncbi:S41 family peptidase [Luteimonas sp. S4-F44]|uniref:S41 family peptidase n=1 Tax=Luteimonas sp. S4-F44 TaxID=2925842 RepID=UPI001F531A37|nr:S41 family peptidase [Luteimonas sp. S4-F44]UNK44054.1 S41 family peptidase [Luteimonas sp. S4-F44]